MAQRTLKWLGYFLVAMAIFLVLFLLIFNWSWLRHPIEYVVKEKTGRTLVIQGNLDVRLGWPIVAVQVSGVTFANPTWAAQPLMLSVKRIDSSIDINKLFHERFFLPTVRLEQPLIFLEIAPDGRKNWLLDRQQKNTKTALTIGRLLLDQGQITYLDSVLHTRILADLTTRPTTPQSSAALIFTATGQYKDMPLAAKGSGGQILALNDATTPYPLNVDGHLGKTNIQASGTITNLALLSALDFNLSVKGESLDQLYPVLGIALPRTPHYEIRSHLIHTDKQWRLENFAGRIGKSDIAGNFSVDQTNQRPFLSGNLTSRLLDLSDLGPTIGERKKTPPKTAAANTIVPATADSQSDQKHKVLPALPFRTQRWASVNADVTLHATRIERAKALPIENLMTRIRMDNSILTLNPLEFGVAGGTLTAAVTLNGQYNPIHASVLVHARKIMLNKLFPTIKTSKTSIGQINGDFDLTGTGNAVKQMLGTASGKIVLLIDNGMFSKMLLEEAQLHIWEIIETKIFGDKNVTLNCAIANFNVNDGVLQTKTLLLDTPITTIIGNGEINMTQESLHMDLNPHTKIMSPIALRTPIYIRGTFAEPDITVNKTDLALQGAGAIALGAINPFLAIIPLVETGPGKQSECGRLIDEAQTSRTKINRTKLPVAQSPPSADIAPASRH